MAKKVEVLFNIFRKPKPRIDDHIFNAELFEMVDLFLEISDHFLNQIFVLGEPGHRGWISPHMHRDIGNVQAADRFEHFRILFAGGDIVDKAGALIYSGMSNLTPERVY